MYNLNDLLDLLQNNENALNTLLPFIEAQHQNQNLNRDVLESLVENFLTRVLQELKGISCEDPELKKDLEYTVVDAAIIEFNKNCNQQQFRSPIAFSQSSRPSQSLINANNAKTEDLIAQFACGFFDSKTIDDLKVLDKSYIFCDRGVEVPGCMQVSHRAAVFAFKEAGNSIKAINPNENQADFMLDECWCDDKVSRLNPYNIRTTIEEGIVTNILEVTKEDPNQSIRLINLGTDRVGTLIILSKLHVLGYKNIDVVNLETTEIDNYPTFKEEDAKYSKFLEKLFGNSIKYTTITSNLNFPGDYQNLIQHITTQPIAQSTFVFAEDLGSVDQPNYDDKYKNSISKIIEQLYLKLPLEYKLNLHFSKSDGNIINSSAKVDNSLASSSIRPRSVMPC